MSEASDEEFDIYCGYVPLSQSEESAGHCLKPPDTLSNLKVYEGKPYRVRTKQPVPEGSPYSLYSLQPMQSKELRDPSSNLTGSDGGTSSLHTRQQLSKQSPYSRPIRTLVPKESPCNRPIRTLVSKESPYSRPIQTLVSKESPYSRPIRTLVSKESPYSRPIRTLVSEENYSSLHTLQTMNPILASESSVPDENGAEFTGNFANTWMGRELDYAPSPLYSSTELDYTPSAFYSSTELDYAPSTLYSSTGSSKWDAFFLNEGNLDGYEEDADFGDDYGKCNDDGEIEIEKFENGKVVFGKSDCGKIDYINYDKGVKYDNTDDAMGTDDESSESDDSEEEELIVIDSDTDSEIVSELSQKDYKYCEYPVGKCNTVIVSEKDYRSLECSKFLNDIIIDFYLNYAFLHILPVEHQSTVHMFSTLFFKRLLQIPKKKRKSANFEEDPAIPMADKRHRRVSGWTKNVDLFSKSVLLIPICEDSHWYLLMVVGLSGEAPFILVLDSLGGLRKRAARIIRQYLACEYEAKQIEGERGFSDADIPSIRPPKPEQPNGTDCGVYLLHYAENIFENIRQFMSRDLPCLTNWFSHEEVSRKRSNIAYLIRKLAKQQKPDNDDYDFQFPYIPFALERDPETDEETDMDVEEVKNVDDYINRLDNLADKKSESSGKAKETVGSESSEVMKTSFSRNRSIRKITGNMERIGGSKTSSHSTSNSRYLSKTELAASKTSSLSTFTSRGLSVTEFVPSKTSSLSTSTSRGFPVSDINPKSELVPPPKNHKSYSGGYKIPRMKNSESTKPQTVVFPTEPVQPDPRSLPSQVSNDDGKTGTDSITRKLNAEEPKFCTSPGNSKSEIEILTPTSCPVYGSRCEGIYHSHPKVNKNRSRTSRNGVNSTRVSLGNDWKSGVSSVNHLDHQYPQTSGLKKSNIVDKLLTDASETSNM